MNQLQRLSSVTFLINALEQMRNETDDAQRYYRWQVVCNYQNLLIYRLTRVAHALREQETT